MKKTLVFIFVLFFAMVGAAYAVPKDNCGCGIGSMIFEGKDGLIFQLFATTTNGCLGNQTFGITSGTLGCEKFATIAMNERLDIFVADNMDNLVVDIATGQGETLDALAELADVPVDSRADLYAVLQNNFDQIYPSDNVVHKDVVSKIVNIIEHI